jgi:diketogulonate reductase-like aldo/keto reductase
MHEKTFQVELNPIWQQKKLIEFCKAKGIHVTAYSPLGGQSRISNINAVLQSEVLKEIAERRGKSVAQVLSIFYIFSIHLRNCLVCT